jgi:hypothetical protein
LPELLTNLCETSLSHFFALKFQNIFLQKTTIKFQSCLLLAPIAGILIFICLYLISTFYYPGGSQASINDKEFSWANNYWCNLLTEKAMNGEHNPARPIAISAMFILCITLACFWYTFPRQIKFKKNIRLLIQVSGSLSMLFAAFLSTNLHDTIVNLASFFGIIAMVGTFAGLLKLTWKKLFWLGIFNLLLVGLNNILYYGTGLLKYLPVIQKITFLFFLLWICLININLYKKQCLPV